MKRRQLIIQFLIVFFIFLVFALFRFYNLDKRIIFDWDQEQFSNQIKNIVVNHKLTLLGPRVISDKGFFLGPYFTYLLIPFYLITKLHPQGLIYFIIFFNVLFFTAIFLILNKIFGFYKTISFLFLWAVNYLLVIYDVIPWWPITIPLGVTLVWFTLFKLYKKNSGLNWLILGLTLGIFANMHFQFIFMILFSIFFIVYLSMQKKFFDIKGVLVTGLGFFLLFIPLFIFDLRHKFLNTTLFIDFFFSKRDMLGSDRFIWLTVFTNFLQPFIYIQSLLLAVLFYMTILLIIIHLYKIKKNYFKFFYLSSLFLWLIFPLCFALYGKRPSEYYFVFLFPFILVSIIDFIFSLKKNMLFLFLTLFLFLNINKLQLNLKPNTYGLYYKDVVVTKIKKYMDNKKFNISFDLPLGRDNGFRYLIDYYNIKQSGNWSDPLVEICVPAKKNDIKIGVFGLKIPK